MALLTKITKMVEIAKNGAHNIVPLLLESPAAYFAADAPTNELNAIKMMEVGVATFSLILKKHSKIRTSERTSLLNIFKDQNIRMPISSEMQTEAEGVSSDVYQALSWEMLHRKSIRF
jgi:hypothetical protein